MNVELQHDFVVHGEVAQAVVLEPREEAITACHQRGGVLGSWWYRGPVRSMCVTRGQHRVHRGGGVAMHVAQHGLDPDLSGQMGQEQHQAQDTEDSEHERQAD